MANALCGGERLPGNHRQPTVSAQGPSAERATPTTLTVCLPASPSALDVAVIPTSVRLARPSHRAARAYRGALASDVDEDGPALCHFDEDLA